MVLFLGIGYISYPQSAGDAPAAKQEETSKVTTVDQAKTRSCAHSQAVSSAGCKWVDADNDGICDTCGKEIAGTKAKLSASATVNRGLRT